MWPIIFQFVRSNVVYITAPFAAIVGFVGYNLENLISDKHTPYNNSIQDSRAERQTDEAMLKDPTNVEKLKLKEDVLGRNLSPSLQQKH